MQVHQAEQRNRCWDLALDERIEVTDIASHDGCKSLSAGGIPPREASGHPDSSALPDTLIATCAFFEWRNGYSHHDELPLKVINVDREYQCVVRCRSSQYSCEYIM